MRKTLRKRYQSEAQILSEIDRAHAQKENLNHLADGIEEQLRRDGPCASEERKLQAIAYRKEADRIGYLKLVLLKRALAEFRTEVFAFESDETVPVIPWKDRQF
jgi:hypothetical protein